MSATDTTQPRPAWQPPVAIALVLCFAVALALRVALLVAGPWSDTSRAIENDSPRYLELGDNLAAHGTFGLASPEVGPMHRPIAELRAQRGELPHPDAHGLRPDALRTPGYPAFLAACDLLGLSRRAILLTQCLIGASIVFPLFLLAKSLLRSPRAGLTAACIVALHPADILYANLFLSDTLFAVAFTWSLTLLVRGHDGKTNGGTITAGLTLAAATLIRPVSFLLAPPVALWMILRDPRRASVLHALVFTAISALPITAWCARNASLGAGFRPTTLDAFTLFSKNAAYVRMASLGTNEYPHDWVRVLNQLHAELRTDIRPGESVHDAMRRLGAEEVRRHPFLFARVLADSAVKFTTDHSAASLFALLGREYRPTGMRSWLTGQTTGKAAAPLTQMILPAAWMGLNTLLAIAALIGIVRLCRGGAWHDAALLAGVIVYFILTTQSLGLERIRLPVLGVQATLAAAAFMPRRRATQDEALPTSYPINVSPEPLRRAA